MRLNEAKNVIDEAISSGRTLVVVGECTVHYHGRAASKLASGERLVIVKSDGSFLVHQNKNMAAINYQPPKGVITAELGDGALVLRASRREPKELLEAFFSRIDFAQSFVMRDDRSLRVFGTEKNLSELLMQDLELIEPGLRPVKSESPLGKGRIDVFALDRDGNPVVIEVKRRTAGLSAVSQLQRYVSEVSKRKGVRVRGVLCAPGISPKALNFLECEGLEFFKLDYEVHNPSAEIKGLQRKQAGLKEFF
ncbi:MAG: endonuclease NucS [Candidatus Diapherotrites archaeon]|nr:endonuclease NucS [Candidatus Diapherotrites archaeon]